jgi:hypothetical protein
MSALALVFGFIGRLYAIRCALQYDLSDLAPHERQLCTPAAGVLWRTNMDAWRLATLGVT